MEEYNTQDLENKYHYKLYNRFPITIVRGNGSIVFDENGREYIDALAGIAVNGIGHCHPKVVEAIKEQAGKLIHCSNLYYNEPQSKLAKLLVTNSDMDRVFFCNSGAEAVEGAIKIARKYGTQSNKNGKIFSFTNCFHGRTIATIAMGKNKYQEGFKPMPEGFEVLEFNNSDMLNDKINNDTVACIIEPIQGEGGIIPAQKEFLINLRKICDKNNALLIFDEIQCGLGRAGALFAYQLYDVKPDIITIAKSLGGGVPIGAALVNEKLADVIGAGNHGTTFGGNPLACAAANATMEVIIEDKLPAQAMEKGKYFIKTIREKTKGIKEVTSIRGAGLMIGIELSFKCADVVKKMMEYGVLANCTADTVIRLLPPLTISYENIDRIIKVMVKSIKEVR
jgi:acetylornithine/N-succinyldiaminopimelate aminotransferase